MVALRFATNGTRATTLAAIVRSVDDLGGATAELLTDRDTALVIGSLPGSAAALVTVAAVGPPPAWARRAPGSIRRSVISRRSSTMPPSTVP